MPTTPSRLLMKKMIAADQRGDQHQQPLASPCNSRPTRQRAQQRDRLVDRQLHQVVIPGLFAARKLVLRAKPVGQALIQAIENTARVGEEIAVEQHEDRRQDAKRGPEHIALLTPQHQRARRQVSACHPTPVPSAARRRARSPAAAPGRRRAACRNRGFQNITISASASVAARPIISLRRWQLARLSTRISTNDPNRKNRIYYSSWVAIASAGAAASRYR